MKGSNTLKYVSTFALMGIASLPLAAQTPQTERVSIGSNGQEPNYGVETPAMSADGRYVVYSSYASNLVVNDTNNSSDVFLYDRQTQTTTRPIRNINGDQVTFGTDTPRISRDGRYIYFASVSNDLVPNSANFVRKLFVLDRQTDTVTRLTNNTNGGEPGNDSFFGGVSADGNWVTFYSIANNLVPNDTNSRYDAFVVHRTGTQTERVSVGGGGAQGSINAYAIAISGDGRYALFNTTSGNMVSNDTNNAPDVFLRDRQTQATTRISVTDDGSQTISSYYGTAMSADARYIAFYGYGSGFLPPNTPAREYAFVKDRLLNRTELVSVNTEEELPNGNSQIGAISDDGQHVVFRSLARNIVANDTNNIEDVFLRDRQSGTTTSLSVDAQGVPRGGTFALLTPDASTAVFLNGTGGLVAGDTNGVVDVFVRTPLTAQYATIYGSLNLEGIDPAASSQPITFVFRSAGNPDEVRTVSVAPNGAFSLSNLPRRTYTVHLSAPKYLATNLIVDASAGDVGNMTAMLRAGDANGDNTADIADLLLLVEHYNQIAPASDYLEAADFNCDGINDIADLTFLVGNYNTVGD